MNKKLKQVLARQRELRRSSGKWRWLTIGLFAVTLPLGAMAFTDGSVGLALPWRWLAFGIVIAGLVWMVVRAGVLFRKPPLRDLAAMLDAGSGLHDGYAISTSIEIHSPRSRMPEEAALLARLHANAAELATSARPSHPWPRLWQAAGAVLGLALLAAILIKDGPTPLGRMLLPWKEITYTKVSLKGPSKKPLEREAFTVSGKVGGKIPPTLRLEIANGPSVTVPVAADGTYQHVFEKGVPSAVVLKAYAGKDGVSQALAISLGDIPHPVAYAHRILAPAYTKQPERIETLPSFSILRKSVVWYSVTLNRPAKGVKLVFDTDSDPLPLVNTPEQPLVWEVKLPALARTCGYRLDVADEDGTYRAAIDLQQIVVLPDKPPVVEITSHNADKLKSPKDTFNLKFDASDDVGLGSLRVLYRRVGNETLSEKMIPLTAPGVKRQNGTWEIPLAELGVKPHDMVMVVVRAIDANTMDGPGIGNSEPVLFEVPEEKDDSKKQDQAGGGGGGQSEQVNPLEIERQLYKETLQLALGRQKTPQAELQQRQVANVGNLQEMMNDAEPGEYADLLNTASKSAKQAGALLQPQASYRPADSLEKALASQAATIDALVKAARLEESQPPSESKEGEGEGKKQYSLTKANSSSEPSDKDDKEKVEQAIADLNKLLKKQEDLNQKVAEANGTKPPQGQEPKQGGEKPDKADAGEGKASQEKLAEGTGSQGKPDDGKPGDAKAGEGKPGEGKPGEGNPETGIAGSPGKGKAGPSGQGNPGDNPGASSPSTPGELAGKQTEIRQMSEEIRRQIESLKKTADGADPGLAAEQLKLAAQYQALAAQSIMQGGSRAGVPGKAAESALREARQLTESLLTPTVDGATEPQVQSAGYQRLIQEYSRRLSYDQ